MFEFIGSITGILNTNTVAFGIIALVTIILLGRRLRGIERRNWDLNFDYQEQMRQDYDATEVEDTSVISSQR